MIKLTALNYKIKTSALQRLHGIKDYNEELMFDWGVAKDKIISIGGGEYLRKPFIEPFEFEKDDYVITEKKFRIRLEDIYIYRENEEGITELTIEGDISYSIKEPVDFIDSLFEKK